MNFRLRDLTLRDGLQSQAKVLPTGVKVELYRRLLAAGVREFQVTSFVSPRRLPQLADAEALWEALRPFEGIRDALIANLRGYERARAAGVGRVEMVLAISSIYHQKNTGKTQEETWREVAEVAWRAPLAGVQLSLALANAWHCSFAGETPEGEFWRWVEGAARLGVEEVGLADTTGQARPEAVYRRVRAVREAFPELTVRVHLHDAGWGLENAQAALEAGAQALDATLGGLGGSPFAGEVGGNLALERLVEAGLAGLGSAALEQARSWLQGQLAAK
ncbi:MULTISPECIES: hypothetical protein [unclassified Meiothermus]|uniref:hypothetical protein n=1 Tax=unclassified Meiothermus TaxID=370471 RepID=UPI000D7BB061|nr:MULTISPECIES: hypothetical protein [unclassified Meiothermus]PZA05989.1 hypothetical protein DNA98_16020 [Meiothermus sp. Pnk-1]RYM35262.1 hypothetical protein EWH23_12320 [Meiothermus sp. PNK-Is4]